MQVVKCEPVRVLGQRALLLLQQLLPPMPRRPVAPLPASASAARGQPRPLCRGLPRSGARGFDGAGHVQLQRGKGGRGQGYDLGFDGEGHVQLQRGEGVRVRRALMKRLSYNCSMQATFHPLHVMCTGYTSPPSCNAVRLHFTPFM